MHRQDGYVLSEISKTVFRIFLAQISSKLHFNGVETAQNGGVNPPKMAKLFKIHKQDAYVLSEISKTVFKIFLAQISSKLQFNGVGQPKTA